MNILLYVLAIVFLIAFPSESSAAAQKALGIWSSCVIPFLFPYMVFCRLLCADLSSLRLPPLLITAVLGMLGGSPSGASLIAANASSLSARNVFVLCALTGTISPMFILGSVSTWIGQSSIGGPLLFCHWFSSILCAWIAWLFCRNKQNEKIPALKEDICNAFNPIRQSIDALLQIGGCIILYSVLAEMLGKILYLFPVLQPSVHAILEVSGGIHAICQSSLSPAAKHIEIAAFLGFGGCSILSQNQAILRPLGIPMRQMVVFAVFRAVISAMVMACMTAWLPIS